MLNQNRIDLSNKSIKRIKEKWLQNNTKLEELKLSHNQIQQIPEKWLENNTNLQYIKLSYNCIKRIPEKWLQNNKNLKKLDLRYNTILTNQLYNLIIKKRVITFKNVEIEIDYLFVNEIELKKIMEIETSGRIKHLEVTNLNSCLFDPSYTEAKIDELENKNISLESVDFKQFYNRNKKLVKQYLSSESGSEIVKDEFRKMTDQDLKNNIKNQLNQIGGKRNNFFDTTIHFNCK